MIVITPPSLSYSRLCCNERNVICVILNEVKNLMESIGYKTEILRLMPQNDITTQSTQEGMAGGVGNGEFGDRGRMILSF
jgi:hypothetical protein